MVFTDYERNNFVVSSFFFEIVIYYPFKIHVQYK